MAMLRRPLHSLCTSNQMKPNPTSSHCVPKVFFFESHPVQYKAPVYQALQRLLPDSFEVIYATDASLRPGNVDPGFAREVVWDVPLLNGYPFRVLNNERGIPMATPGSLTGSGIFTLLRRERPVAIVLTQLSYRFDQTAYLAALALRIPILIRQETQDAMYAATRTRLKSILRSLTYRLVYSPARHAFVFGALNRDHLRRHGFPENRLTFARFSVPNPFESTTSAQMAKRRSDTRHKLQIAEENVLVAFFGKFIAKKAPQLIPEAIRLLPEETRKRIHLVFVGSGELLDFLKLSTNDLRDEFGVCSTFTGFINQSALPNYYLAADIMILPSVQEAWGLVVNEALNAGCATILSTSVGCQREFSGLERVRVVETGSAQEIASAIVDLARFPRDFAWAREHMANYSTEAAARGVAGGIRVFLN